MRASRALSAAGWSPIAQNEAHQWREGDLQMLKKLHKRVSQEGDKCKVNGPENLAALEALATRVRSDSPEPNAKVIAALSECTKGQEASQIPSSSDSAHHGFS